jgi:hypothetical protein
MKLSFTVIYIFNAITLVETLPVESYITPKKFYNIDTSAKCYKTFFRRNLHL